MPSGAQPQKLCIALRDVLAIIALMLRVKGGGGGGGGGGEVYTQTGGTIPAYIPNALMRRHIHTVRRYIYTQCVGR